MKIWNEGSLDKFLSTQRARGVEIGEYLLLIDFINDIKPDTFIDVGTYLGHSSYVLASCCDSIKYSYTIENIDSPEYYPKPEARKEEHGKFIDKKLTVFLTSGYEGEVLTNLIKKHPDAFVFWDAGKNTMKVFRQLELSYENKIRYIAVHDTGLRRVRRAINRVIKLGWYRIVDENVKTNPQKGVTILELVR